MIPFLFVMFIMGIFITGYAMGLISSEEPIENLEKENIHLLEALREEMQVNSALGNS